MDPCRLKANNHFQLVLEKLDNKNFSGAIELFRTKTNLTIPFNGHCYKISDVIFEMFFNIDWEIQKTKKSYTIFTGRLTIGKYNIVELSLNWFLNCDITKESRIGSCKMSNELNSINYSNEIINFPFPNLEYIQHDSQLNTEFNSNMV